MRIDDIYQIYDESIPRSWVLTVRKCECGQTLYWDKRNKTWHCMKETCPLHKSHVKKYHLSREKENRIIELGEVLTVKEISYRLKVPQREVMRVLRENDIL
jgi:hypothetical protein